MVFERDGFTCSTTIVGTDGNHAIGPCNVPGMSHENTRDVAPSCTFTVDMGDRRRPSRGCSVSSIRPAVTRSAGGRYFDVILELVRFTSRLPTQVRQVQGSSNGGNLSIWVGVGGAGTSGTITFGSSSALGYCGGVAIPVSTTSGILSVVTSGSNNGTGTTITAASLTPPSSGNGAIQACLDVNGSFGFDGVSEFPVGRYERIYTGNSATYGSVATYASPPSGSPLAPTWTRGTFSHNWLSVGLICIDGAIGSSAFETRAKALNPFLPGDERERRQQHLQRLVGERVQRHALRCHAGCDWSLPARDRCGLASATPSFAETTNALAVGGPPNFSVMFFFKVANGYTTEAVLTDSFTSWPGFYWLAVINNGNSGKLSFEDGNGHYAQTTGAYNDATGTSA